MILSNSFFNHFKNILFWFSCLLAALPLMPSDLQIKIFILFGIVAILDNRIFSSTVKDKVPNHLIGFPLIFYFIYISSILYSEDISEAMSVLEKKSALIALPFILFICKSRFSARQIRLILLIFICSCFLFSLYLLVHVDFYNLQLRIEEIGFLQAVTNLRNEFAIRSGIHPTYLALYFLFSCLVISLFLLGKEKYFIPKYLLVLIFLTLLCTSMLLASRMPLMAFICCLFLIVGFAKGISFNVKSITVGIIILIMALSYFFVPSFKYRVNETFKTNLAPPVGVHYNSTNLRIGLLCCSMEVISNNWILGVGIGDAQNQLNECLYRFETEAYKKFNYNTHNQYLSIWLNSGIIPLVLFIMLLCAAFNFAYRKNDKPFMFFILFVALCMVTENLLSRQAGTLFFIFFYFVFCNRSNSN